MRQPKISDARASIPYFPGDRVLVTTAHSLDSGKLRTLERSIRKFVGHEMRLLIINVTQFRLVVNRASGGREELFPFQVSTDSIINVSTKRINFSLGDSLHLLCRGNSSSKISKMLEYVKHWAGKDIPVFLGDF